MLVEGSEIGAGASGRNLGAIQHPLDPVLAPLYHESLSRYHALADAGIGDFTIGRDPAGLLLLSRDHDAAVRQADRLRAAVPELDPRLLDADAVHEVEPSLRRGLSAVRLETGYPVPPAAATAAWADLAEERGARFVVGRAARIASRPTAGPPASMLDDGTPIAAGCRPGGRRAMDAGPRRAGGRLAPDRADLRRDHPAALRRTARRRPASSRRTRSTPSTGPWPPPSEPVPADPGDDPPSLFSLASAAGISTLGSTLPPGRARPGVDRPAALRRASAFLPAIVEAEVVGRRMCARPQSVDGRPFIGSVDVAEGLFVCAGHGPWGISTGPASAAMAARAILDGTPPPPQLAANRAT